MKNKFKKIISIIVVFLFLSSNNYAFAASSHVSRDLESIEDVIISQALDLDCNSKFSSKSFQAVNLQKDAGKYSVINTMANKNAIQSVYTEGNLTEVTTILPYKQLETGELVNSFEYVNNENQLFATLPPGTPITENFVDVSVTVSAYYFNGYSNGVQVFRHDRVEAYWNSSKTISVRKLDVDYVSRGDLYKYPDCYSDFDAAFVQADYRETSSISVTYPNEGVVYGDSNNSMPTNRVLYLSDYFEHGGQIIIEILYILNGTGKTATTNYMVYTK